MSIDDIRNETYNDMLDKLDKHHIVAVPRPTGFGKTTMMMRLIKSDRYKKILYVYPITIIRNVVVDMYYNNIDRDTMELYHDISSVGNVDLISYYKYSKLSISAIDNFEYDCIIFDECHRAGGLKVLDKILYTVGHISADIIGLTATPNRGDGFDVIEKVFKNITTYPYTLHDAFTDRLYKIPYYCYFGLPSELEVDKSLTNSAFTAGQEIDNIKISQVLKRHIVESLSEFSVEEAIRDTCDTYIKDTNYMKFICFFSNHTSIEELGEKVTLWFKKAYMYHTIRVTEVSTRKKDTIKNIDKISNLNISDNTIDLIFCVDMLNMGYHVNDITGIFMYRTTNSDVIYPQEYGRILSSGCEKEHVVFDIVDNLHRSAMFSTTYHDRNIKFNTQKNGDTDDEGASYDEGTSYDDSADDDNELNNFSGFNDVRSKLKVENSNNKWYRHINDLGERDIKIARYSATYREQIAKLVAEPMHMRCREAFEAHFRRWCVTNNIPYPISAKELKNVYGYDQSEFVQYFSDVVRKNKLKYPMKDAQKLLDIGKHNDGIPLSIFARWKNVAVRDILDLLLIA